MRRTLIGAVGAVAGAVLVLAGHAVTRTGSLLAGGDTGVRPPSQQRPGPFGPGFGDDGGEREDGGGQPAPAPTGGSGGTTRLPSGTRTVDGPAVGTPFGPVQVRVSFAGGRITDVQAIQTPSEHMRSVAINQYATPILHQEVLTAQSANVDLVSGATWTSEAYIQSLQSAIDQANR
jgi:uncharacterized protein with FMN-binding domain